MSALQYAGIGVGTLWSAAYTAGLIFVAVLLNAERNAATDTTAGNHLALPPARDDLTAPTGPRHLSSIEPDDTVEINLDRPGRHSAEHLLVATVPAIDADQVRAAAGRHITVPGAELIRPYTLGLNADADTTTEREPAADWARTGGAA